MTKKILFCATLDIHFKSFHLPYLKWFKEQGWEVHVAAKGEMNLPYVDKKFNIEIHRSPLHILNIIAYKQLKMLMDQNMYDIIHCHTPMGGVLARLAARKARRQGTRVIYTAHGFHFCKGAPPLNWLIYYPIEKILSSFTDLLITINEEDYSLAVKRLVGVQRIEHVHGVGVDTEIYKPLDASAKMEQRIQNNYRPDDFLMFYAAEFNKNKNQQLLIKALAFIKDEIPSAKLLLAGEGPLLNNCRRLAKKLNVEHMVDFLGYRNDIPSLLPMCDIAVSSSLREGLPVNIMEAMACGLPVVATENRGHRELIRKHKNGWILNRNEIYQIAERIKMLAEIPMLREQLGMTGRQMIESRYGIHHVMEEKSHIYRLFMNETVEPEIQRILHVVVNMNRGGAETLIMNLYRNMDRSKVQFDFLTSKKGMFDSEILEMGGRIHRIPYVTEIGHLKYTKTLDHFFQAHSEYRIVHAHMDRMSGLVLRSAKKASIPIRIAHSHNTRSEGAMAVRVYKWIAGKYILPSATHLVSCSQAAAKWLYAKKSSQSMILQNGIESQRFAYSSEIRKQIRDELKISDCDYVIGHVGRFAQQKNHAFLIDIFVQVNRLMPNSSLVLVGDGPLRADIEKKVEEMNITGKVKFLGIRSDIDRLLQAFDVFVFPSFHEGLPVTLIEAQGAGLPCIISSVVTQEVDMGMGLIDYFSLDNKTLCIEQIINSATKEFPRTVSGTALALKGYDIKNTAEWAQEFYISLAR